MYLNSQVSSIFAKSGLSTGHLTTLFGVQNRVQKTFLTQGKAVMVIGHSFFSLDARKSLLKSVSQFKLHPAIIFRNNTFNSSMIPDTITMNSFSRFNSTNGSSKHVYDTHDIIRTDSILHSRKPSQNLIDSPDSTILEELSDDMLVFEDFLTEAEEQSLLSEIEPYMKKLRYEYDHWDDAIHGYRETEKRHWNEANQAIIQRVRDLAFPPDVPAAQLAYVHILDLEKTGYIKAHVDSVRFCGSTITGMSLLSDSVMKLTHEKNKDGFAYVLLKRRSLYLMKGGARYNYTHAILADQQSYFKNHHIPRDRRVSVICRNEAADLHGFSETTVDSTKKDS